MMQPTQIRFLDLFAGGGGLSEGFIRAGFQPIAHVESDKAACFTLRTRAAYHELIRRDETATYNAYLNAAIDRDTLYGAVSTQAIDSVINEEIGAKTIKSLFTRIDQLLNGNRLELIIGGPPCQAYSIVGRSRDRNGMRGDKRNYLFVYYAEFLKRYRPKYFVFENVIGLLSAKDANGVSYFETMRRLFRDCGYETEYQVISADQYNIPQARRRIILVGRRGRKSAFFPNLRSVSAQTTVGSVLEDLPSLHAGEGSVGPCKLRGRADSWLYENGIRNDAIPVTWHQARPNSDQDLKIYRRVVEQWNTKRERLDYNSLPDELKTHNNRSAFTDRFKVVAADLPHSHTVVAHIAKDGHYYIHPDLEQNRSITPREAARLQTFPDDYFFESWSRQPRRSPAFRQIGNAVPVLLAQQIAETLRDKWQ